MVFFRDENVVVISPGSSTTLANAGLGESLTPASIEVPSRVYKHPTEENWFCGKGEEKDAIYPIQNGKIINLPAFNYLFKLIYKHVQAQMSSNIAIGVLMLGSFRWSRLEVEEITRYAFESLKIPGFTIVPNALAAAFAHNVQDALVIDVGKSKTEITPINDYAVVEHAQKVINHGGNTINQNLKELLPDLTDDQVESLKKSQIYEVLNESDTKNSWFALNNNTISNENEDGEEDGVVDIAAIVSSGRTREILDEREQQSKGEKKKETPNKDLEHNQFEDKDGKVMEVGKQRFHGTEQLVKYIVDACGESVRKISHVNRRQDCWDNIIIIGRGSSVKGFKEAVLVALQERYVILRSTTYSEMPSTFNTGHNTPNGGTPFYPQQQIHTQGHGQAPTQIRPAKMADYFPEWKKHGWEDASFLGGQIAAKAIFGGQIDNSFISRSDYNQVGPAAIWDI